MSDAFKCASPPLQDSAAGTYVLTVAQKAGNRNGQNTVNLILIIMKINFHSFLKKIGSGKAELFG